MSEYWINHYDSNAVNFPGSPLKQVGKTVGGCEVDQAQIDLIVRTIHENLCLSKSDYVADLCCGNGLITKSVAKLSKHIIAADFSKQLIGHARLHNVGSNIEYIVSNVSELSADFFLRPSKIYMWEGLQYLEANDFIKLLKQASRSPQQVLLFVAGIPDIEKLNVFYDTNEKLAFYREREVAGEPHIGKWWSKGEIKALAESVDLKARILAQDPSLYTAHYRFDCLIEKA